jgi:HIV Tat-specific factor 1
MDDSWYYVDASGSQQGPCTYDDLVDLYVDGEITLETILWTASFGDTWRPLQETYLKDRLQNAAESAQLEAPAAKKRRNDRNLARSSQSQQSTTNVYVTQLPTDESIVTEDGLLQHFKRCGLVRRVKLYRDKEQGMALKGDALVTYLKPDSVAIACTVLDGSDFGGSAIHVEPATYQPDADASKESKENEEAHITDKPRPPKRKGRNAEVAQLYKKLQYSVRDDAIEKGREEEGEEEQVHGDRTVVLRNMFDPTELEKSLTAAVEIREDVEAMAKSFGPIFKVRVYETRPDGVVTIKFKKPQDAATCARMLHGRSFDGRKVLAELWDGEEVFAAASGMQEDEERLEEYSAWIDQE